MNISPPKFGVQVGHAVLSTCVDCIERDSKTFYEYFRANQPKIVVECDDLDHYNKLVDILKDTTLPYGIITDEGRTEFDGPTPTAIGIGPCYKSELPSQIKRLRIYKDD